MASFMVLESFYILYENARIFWLKLHKFACSQMEKVPEYIEYMACISVCISFYFSLDFLFYHFVPSGEEDDGTEGGLGDGGAAWRGAGSSSSRSSQSRWMVGGSLMAVLSWTLARQLVSPLQAVMTKAGGAACNASGRCTIRRTRPLGMRVIVTKQKQRQRQRQKQQEEKSCLRVSKCSWKGCGCGCGWGCSIGIGRTNSRCIRQLT